MNLLLVDAHSLGYFCQQGATLTAGGRQVQAIFGMLRNIRKYCRELNARPYVLWDGEPIKRTAFYPKYKGKRSDNPKLKEMRIQFRQQRDDIKLMLSLLGIRQLVAHDGEADDLAGMLCRRFKSHVEHIYLYTGDNDWLTLLDDNVSLLNVRKDEITRLSYLGEKTGLQTPRQYLEFKALVGDKSDEIDGVGGIGESGALELLNECGSVIEFVKKARSGEITVDDFKGRGRRKYFALANNEFNKKVEMGMLDIFRRNVKLMNLADLEMMPENIETIPPRYDEAEFENKCLELSFQSIVDEIEVFVTPFKRFCL